MGCTSSQENKHPQKTTQPQSIDHRNKLYSRSVRPHEISSDLNPAVDNGIKPELDSINENVEHNNNDISDVHNHDEEEHHNSHSIFRSSDSALHQERLSFGLNKNVKDGDDIITTGIGTKVKLEQRFGEVLPLATSNTAPKSTSVATTNTATAAAAPSQTAKTPPIASSPISADVDPKPSSPTPISVDMNSKPTNKKMDSIDSRQYFANNPHPPPPDQLSPLQPTPYYQHDQQNNQQQQQSPQNPPSRPSFSRMFHSPHMLQGEHIDSHSNQSFPYTHNNNPQQQHRTPQNINLATESEGTVGGNPHSLFDYSCSSSYTQPHIQGNIDDIPHQQHIVDTNTNNNNYNKNIITTPYTFPKSHFSPMQQHQPQPQQQQQQQQYHPQIISPQQRLASPTLSTISHTGHTPLLSQPLRHQQHITAHQIIPVPTSPPKPITSSPFPEMIVNTPQKEQQSRILRQKSPISPPHVVVAPSKSPNIQFTPNIDNYDATQTPHSDTSALFGHYYDHQQQQPQPLLPADNNDDDDHQSTRSSLFHHSVSTHNTDTSSFLQLYNTGVRHHRLNLESMDKHDEVIPQTPSSLVEADQPEPQHGQSLPPHATFKETTTRSSPDQFDNISSFTNQYNNMNIGTSTNQDILAMEGLQTTSPRASTPRTIPITLNHHYTPIVSPRQKLLKSPRSPTSPVHRHQLQHTLASQPQYKPAIDIDHPPLDPDPHLVDTDTSQPQQ